MSEYKVGVVCRDSRCGKIMQFSGQGGIHFLSMCLLHEITHSCPFIHSEMIASITYEKTLLRWCHSRKLAFMNFLENKNRTGSDSHGTVKMIGPFIFDRLCSQVSFCRTNQGGVFFFFSFFIFEICRTEKWTDSILRALQQHLFDSDKSEFSRSSFFCTCSWPFGLSM